MYVNPTFVLLGIWILPWIAPIWLESDLFQPLSFTLKTAILIMCASVFLFSIFLNATLASSRKKFLWALRDNIDIHKIYSLMKALAKVWLGIYFLTIIYSGGFPLIWVLIGDGRTYVDFGLPTVSGFANMLRALILSLAVLVIFIARQNEIPVPRRAIFIGFFMIFSAFILETGRGNGIVLLLHPVAYLFLAVRFSIANTIKFVLFFFTFIVAMSLIQVMRYGVSLSYLLEYAENQGFGDIPFFVALLVPFFSYIYLPLVNLDINLPLLPDLAFQLNYSVQGFFPTIVRGLIFGAEKDYGILISEANNVTSFVTPLVRDFGIYGGFFVGTSLLCLTQYSFFRCRQGSVRHILIFPPLFMSMVLSFFSLFYTLQVVVLYLITGSILARYVTVKKAENEKKHV